MRRNHRHWPTLLAFATCLCAGAVAHAQIAVPQVPSLPVGVPDVVTGVRGTLQDAADGTLQAVTRVRDRQIRELLRAHPESIDLDPDGAPVVRAEIVAIDPNAALLALLGSSGFGVGRDVGLDGLGLRVVRLRAPAGLSTNAAMTLARSVAPDAVFDYNHLYLPASAGSPGAASPAAAAMHAPHGMRVGLVDSAPDPDHPAFSGVDVRAWGCDGRRLPDAHGTAVASLLAGRAVASAAPGGVLFAADVYCGAPTGGAAVEVARALAWMARERVGVVNVSLVGPGNAVLERAVARMVERGHVLVAAVGNDGPAAKPLYPASYPGVVGVSAVNARLRVLPESGRGPQVDFAAPGADMVAAAPGRRWSSVRGTSYAAPLVARLAAQSLPAPDRAGAPAAIDVLVRTARRVPGPAHAYGRGVVAGDMPRDRPPPAP